METRFKEADVENIQDDIRYACSSLEELGFDSLVVITSKDRDIELGSAKGRRFIEDFPDYFEEFIHYCRVKVEKQINNADEADPFEETKHQVSVPTVIIGPTGKKKENTLSPKKEETPIVESHMSDENSQEIDFTVEITDNLDDDFDDGDESGLEEEFEIYLDQDHTIDTTKIAKKIAKRYSNLRKGKKVPLKKQKVVVQDAFERAFEQHIIKGEKRTKSKRSPSTPSTPQKTFDCDLCDKKYSSKKTLVIHQRKHTGDAPFICLTCGKAFRSSTFLKSHETVHSKELKYNCEKCDKAFAWKDSLRRHNIAIHSDERRHVCDICGSSFKDQSAMTKHKMRHTGQKNHACEVCGKLFMFKYQVTEHFRVHTGVKKFGCGMCDQRFTTKFSALKHQNKQHPHHVPVVFI